MDVWGRASGGDRRDWGRKGGPGVKGPVCRTLNRLGKFEGKKNRGGKKKVLDRGKEKGLSTGGGVGGGWAVHRAVQRPPKGDNVRKDRVNAVSSFYA